jgi:Flp pilus assembly protein TadB
MPLNDSLLLSLIVLELVFILLIAFWFSALARQQAAAETEALKEAHAKEREKLRVNAERQKNKLADQKHKELLRETKRAYAAANLRAGSTVIALLLLGGVMLYTQLFTFGSLLLTAGGSGLLGYLARVKQEKRFRFGNPAVQQVQVSSGKPEKKRLPER